ncbi:MAG: hypothetical protein U0324_16345 [Polyangiales bacterium]
MTVAPLAPRLLADGSSAGRPPRRPHVMWFAPDGEAAYWVSASEREGLSVWRLDLDTGESSLLVERAVDTPVAVARDVGRVFWSEDRGATLRWFDVATGGGGSRPCAPAGGVTACSDDGAHVARCPGSFERWDMLGSREREVVVERTKDGAAVARFGPGTEAVAFAGQGAAALVIFHEATPRRLCLRTGESVALAAPTGGAFHPMAERGGARVLASTPGEPGTLYDLHTGEASTLPTIAGDGRPLDFVAGSLAYLGVHAGKASLLVRALDSGEVRVVTRSAGCRAALSPDAGRALVHEAGPLACFDLANATSRTWHQGHDATVVDVAWTPDGALLASLGADGAVRVWEVAPPALRWTLETGVTDAKARCAFTPDGRGLYAVGASGLVAWDVSTGVETARAPSLRDADAGLTVSDDGRLLLVSSARRGDRIVDITAGVRVVGATRAPDRRRAFVHHRPTQWPAAFVDATTVQVLRCERVPDFAQTGTRWHRSRFSLRGRLRDAVDLPALDHVPITLVEGDSSRALIARDGATVIVHLDAPDAPERPLGPSLGPVAHATPTAYVSREGEALVVRSMVDGVARARVDTRRRRSLARLSPDGARLAVAWADGAVEAFDVRGG